ncbi:MAG: tyrosine-type recombinase/integrase [Campylobacterales bacterium]|nr:tyrosine-type recombinase/integrase [Campylobacterales bacterium]
MSNLLEAFNEYLRVVKSLSHHTIESYLLDIGQLQEFIQKDIALVQSDDILAFLAQFPNKRTLNRKLSSINQFFDFIHREFKSHPSKPNIAMAKVPHNLPKYLSFEEIAQGLEQIDRSKKFGLRDYALILFLYATGARISEALSLQRSDIHEGWVHIRFAKNQKERLVPVAPMALEALQTYLNIAPITTTDIWLNHRNKPLSRVSAYKIVKKYLGVSPHVLRHSFASSLIIGGANLKVVQDLLGHSSLVTTQIYTHIQTKELQQTIQTHHPLAKEVA